MSSHKMIVVIMLGVSLPGMNAAAAIKIACVGTSITYGAGVSDGESYPAVLQTLLGPSYTVVNEGSTGRILMIIMDEDISYLTGDQFSEVMHLAPNVIIMEFGSNDSKPEYWDSRGIKGQFTQDIHRMIDTFQTMQPRPQLYLMLPPPAFENKYGIRSDTLQNTIIPILKNVAAQRGMPTIDCNTPMLDHPEWFQDGVHPNATGADTIAHIICRNLSSVPITAPIRAEAISICDGASLDFRIAPTLDIVLYHSRSAFRIAVAGTHDGHIAEAVYTLSGKHFHPLMRTGTGDQ